MNLILVCRREKEISKTCSFVDYDWVEAEIWRRENKKKFDAMWK